MQPGWGCPCPIFLGTRSELQCSRTPRKHLKMADSFEKRLFEVSLKGEGGFWQEEMGGAKAAAAAALRLCRAALRHPMAAALRGHCSPLPFWGHLSQGCRPVPKGTKPCPLRVHSSVCKGAQLCPNMDKALSPKGRSSVLQKMQPHSQRDAALFQKGHSSVPKGMRPCPQQDAAPSPRGHSSV